MNATRKKNLMRAATSAIIFIILFATMDFFCGELEPIWRYLIECLVFFLVYFALECTFFHPENETKEEREAKDLAMVESLKKQTEPFRGKDSDTDTNNNN